MTSPRGLLKVAFIIPSIWYLPAEMKQIHRESNDNNLSPGEIVESRKSMKSDQNSAKQEMVELVKMNNYYINWGH